MLVPKLRFKRDDGTEYPEWSLLEFGSFCQAIDIRTSDTEKYPLYSLTIEEGVTPKTDRYIRDYLIKKEGDSYKIVPNSAFVYNPMNLRFGALKANHSGLTVCVSGYYDVFAMGQPNTLYFWENYLTTPKMLNYYDRISTGSLIEKKRVYYSEFLKIKKSLPCIEEQQKIADFLSAVDEVIARSEAEVQSLEQQKKASMQKIFSQEVRFKREDGTEYPDWEKKKIGELTSQLITRNKENTSYPVYSVNNIKGFIPQLDQFKDREVASSDKTNYKIVEYHHFAYNPSRINVGSIAYLNERKTVIVSPLYVVFECTGIIPEYLNLYVRTKDFHNQRKANTVGSVRDSLTYEGFSEITMFVPCLEEQQKISDFLSTYDEAISYAKQELEKWKELKKGLLQKMFI